MVKQRIILADEDISYLFELNKGEAVLSLINEEEEEETQIIFPDAVRFVNFLIRIMKKISKHLKKSQKTEEKLRKKLKKKQNQKNDEKSV